jgi:hypothetical protein
MIDCSRESLEIFYAHEENRQKTYASPQEPAGAGQEPPHRKAHPEARRQDQRRQHGKVARGGSRRRIREIIPNAVEPANGVFINCPFDKDYAPIFEALIFTIHACDFEPRSAREIEDSSQTRIDKLYNLIGECRYGIHDLSRTELDRLTKLPRFNMPLELGIFLGAKRFGGKEQKFKRCLVLDIEPYRYMKFASDLSGMDIQTHDGRPERAITVARDWLANVSRRKIPGAGLLIRSYRRFLKTKPAIARKRGFDSKTIPYADFNALVTSWLIERPAN